MPLSTLQIITKAFKEGMVKTRLTDHIAKFFGPIKFIKKNIYIFEPKDNFSSIIFGMSAQRGTFIISNVIIKK